QIYDRDRLIIHYTMPFTIPITISGGISGHATSSITASRDMARIMTAAVISTNNRTVKPTARLAKLMPTTFNFAFKLGPGSETTLRHGANSVLISNGAENARIVDPTRFQPSRAWPRQPSPYHHTKNWVARSPFINFSPDPKSPSFGQNLFCAHHRISDTLL